MTEVIDKTQSMAQPDKELVSHLECKMKDTTICLVTQLKARVRHLKIKYHPFNVHLLLVSGTPPTRQEVH